MLLTNWLVLVTAGQSIDGREIKEEWLTQAAESYDPDHYEAVIDAEHDLEWYGSYGSVHEVRLAQNKNGEATLEGRLRPNMRLIEQYQRGQRLHFSVMLHTDFRKTGKAYLFRLALTDEPASVGTSRLQLFTASNNPEQKEVTTTELQPLEMSLPGEEKSLFEKFKAWLNTTQEFKPTGESQPENEQEHEMTPEQFKKLTEQNDAVIAGLAALTEKFTAQASAEEETEEETPAMPEVKPEKPEAESSKEELSALAEKMDGLMQEFKKLKTTAVAAQEFQHDGNAEEIAGL